MGKVLIDLISVIGLQVLWWGTRGNQTPLAHRCHIGFSGFAPILPRQYLVPVKLGACIYL